VVKTVVFEGFPSFICWSCKVGFCGLFLVSQVSTIWWKRDVMWLEKLPEFYFEILLKEAIICVA
jgi:hypothetical protein